MVLGDEKGGRACLGEKENRCRPAKGGGPRPNLNSCGINLTYPECARKGGPSIACLARLRGYNLHQGQKTSNHMRRTGRILGFRKKERAYLLRKWEIWAPSSRRQGKKKKTDLVCRGKASNRGKMDKFRACLEVTLSSKSKSTMVKECGRGGGRNMTNILRKYRSPGTEDGESPLRGEGKGGLGQLT